MPHLRDAFIDVVWGNTRGSSHHQLCVIICHLIVPWVRFFIQRSR